MSSTIDFPNGTCVVVLGGADCAARLPLIGRGFDLAYMDPPFNTGRAFMTSGDAPRTAFVDRFESVNEFVRYVVARARLAWNLLLPGGSLVVHVDPSTSHYLKVALDGELGASQFASEIVWRYRRWPVNTPNFQAMHDVLLRYVKGAEEPIFHVEYEPLAPSTQKTFGTGKQRASKDASGRRAPSQASETEASPGVPLADVWEIPIVAPSGRERTGYPTQKPIALLKRLVRTLSNPGGWVLDPFCGSGTTLAAAVELGRNAIGIDSSSVAIEYTEKRLDTARKALEAT